MKWVWIILGALVILVVLVIVIGALLPKRHVASRTMKLNQPAEKVWAAITDHANEPSWRGDLKAKERLPDRDGHPVWRETRGRGDFLTLETLVFDPPAPDRPGKMVSRIADENLPFGGTWTYDLKPVDAGSCALTITEDGEIYNPVFRFMARFVLDHRSTLTGYLTAISRKFGQEPAFED